MQNASAFCPGAASRVVVALSVVVASLLRLPFGCSGRPTFVALSGKISADVRTSKAARGFVVVLKSRDAKRNQTKNNKKR